MLIGIVGGGVVGSAMVRMCPSALTYDPHLKPSATQADINDRCDIAFICVPTPTRDDGVCDTSIVEESVQWLKTPLIVIRSTVSPGTTDRLRSEYGKRVLFQPEYLGETVAHPMNDEAARDFVVLGGKPDDRDMAIRFYHTIYNSRVRFHLTSALIAEVAKYMENAFFAVKVTFVNEMYDIARAHGIDYNALREIWLSDPRVERTHTFVYPENRGFGGKCLPKDVSAIIASSEQRGYSPELLKAAMACNDRFRKSVGKVSESACCAARPTE